MGREPLGIFLNYSSLVALTALQMKLGVLIVFVWRNQIIFSYGLWIHRLFLIIKGQRWGK